MKFSLAVGALTFPMLLIPALTALWLAGTRRRAAAAASR